MAFDTLLWVRQQRTGNVASRSVLRVLADHAGQDHSCYLRTRLIADETDLSEAGVRKALTRLIDAGLVRVFERYSPSGARRSNRYQILVEGADTPPPDAEDWAATRERPPLQQDDLPLNAGEGEAPQQGEGFPIKEASREEAPPVKGRAARVERSTATRVPDDFQPDEKMRAWFVAEKLPGVIDGRLEHQKFMNYWLAKPGREGKKLDWRRTWMNWMLNAAERARRRPGTALAPVSGAPYRPSTTDQRVGQALALAEKYEQMGM